MTVNTFLVGPWIAWDGTISIRVLAYGKRRIHLSSVELICVIPSYILLHHGVSSHSEEHYAGNALFDYRRIAHPSLHSLLSSRLYDKHKHSDGAHNLQRRKHHSSKRWQIKTNGGCHWPSNNMQDMKIWIFWFIGSAFAAWNRMIVQSYQSMWSRLEINMC
jgi:hypothetical protein